MTMMIEESPVESQKDEGMTLVKSEIYEMTPEQIAAAKKAHVKKYHRIKSPGELLSSLGVHGWDAIEDLILSNVAFPYTNIVLVGEAGGAKTTACRKVLTAAYGSEDHVRLVNTHIEDELSLGICDVPNLNDKKMETFFTDSSIIKYRGVILDEVNRAREDLRKIYMPLLSERRIAGHICDAITVIGTMNPLGEDYNTEPLDLAFAERFSCVINTREFHLLDEKDRHMILGSVAGALSLDVQIEFTEEVILQFQAALHATALKYDEIEQMLIKPLTRYTDSIMCGAKNTKPALRLQSARTGKSLMRNILRLVAFHAAVYGEEPTQIVEAMARKALMHISTAELYDEPIEKEKLEALHAKAKQFLSVKDAFLGYITQITNPVEQLAALLSKSALTMADVDRGRLLQHNLDEVQRTFLSILSIKTRGGLHGLGDGRVDSGTMEGLYKDLILLSDAAIISLEILSAQERFTDAVVVQASQLFTTIAMMSRPGMLASEVTKKFMARDFGTSVLRQSLMARILTESKAYSLGVNPVAVNEPFVYMTPAIDRLSQKNIPTTMSYMPSSIIVGSKESMQSYALVAKSIEDYIIRIYCIRPGSPTPGEQALGIADPVDRSRLIMSILNKRLEYWAKKKEHYDAISVN